MTDTLESRLAGLMVAAQSGDEAAYRALLRGCVPVVAATARYQGLPADRVDDVVQDVLITLHRARATYDPGRAFLPWLRAIAQRRAVDALRRSGRHTRREVYDPIAYDGHADDQGSHADAKLEQAQRAEMLGQAIATLPAGQRQAIELLGLREQSLEETASQTGRAKVALKVNLHRAIRSLRVRLSGTAPDGREGGDV